MIEVVTPLQVLIIEDDADTRANLRDILELDDHRIMAVSSVAEAFSLSKLPSFGVIVLDRRLPDGNAEDFIPRLKELAPSTDIIVVTGHADVGSAITALKRGAADYILKPINPEVLRASLGRTAKQLQLRRAKERSEANFRELIEAVDFMVVILCQNRRITYANRFTKELTGYSADQLRDRSISAFLDPEALNRVEHQIQRLHAGLRANELEIPIRCQDGQQRWILWNVRYLPDFEGARAILSVGHDVTERKELERRTMQAERLAAIGQMVTGLAHESRNALQRSQAGLDLLKDELRGHPDALELVERIQRSQLHLHHLYEEVRSYAAPITLHREWCQMDQIWRDTWSQLEVTLSKKPIQLREDVDDVDLTCHVDPITLGQVFRNIFENAMEVSRAGDEIVVQCRYDVLLDRPAIRISIRDHGPGLNPEQAARIFDPFYTTKTRGTGLGMAISQRIVDAHGGRIFVGRPDGPGAEIVMVLPRDAK